ncbi:hypothetical protein PFDG_04963, partial [Plasmodium falciparum Dd2]
IFLRVKNFKNKSTYINDGDDTNTERISILDSKGSEMNASSIENVGIESNHLLSNNTNNKIIRGQIHGTIERNNILKINLLINLGRIHIQPSKIQFT